MKKVTDREKDDELRPEYDLSQMKGGVRGKYAKRVREGTNLVLLSPEAFSGREVLTYAVLDNHFHILLYVPQRESISDELFLRRLGHLYDGQMVRTLGEHLQQLRQDRQGEAAETLRADYTYRMYDLSEFVKTLKQRFTCYLRGEAYGPGADGRPGKPGFSAEQVRAVLAEGGRLPLSEVLRCRVRYFSDGCVLGSQAYLEDVFLRHRSKFSAGRKTLARPMRGADWGGICSARRLRVEVISPPAAA